jgi:hypothetical protein
MGTFAYQRTVEGQNMSYVTIVEDQDFSYARIINGVPDVAEENGNGNGNGNGGEENGGE